MSENVLPFLLSLTIGPPKQIVSITFTSVVSLCSKSILQPPVKGYQLKEFIFEVLK